jgi:hypothetical protein
LKIKITISGKGESCPYVELFHSCIWEREDLLSVTDIAKKICSKKKQRKKDWKEISEDGKIKLRLEK